MAIGTDITNKDQCKPQSCSEGGGLQGEVLQYYEKTGTGHHTNKHQSLTICYRIQS